MINFIITYCCLIKNGSRSLTRAKPEGLQNALRFGAMQDVWSIKNVMQGNKKNSNITTIFDRVGLCGQSSEQEAHFPGRSSNTVIASCSQISSMFVNISFKLEAYAHEWECAPWHRPLSGEIRAFPRKPATLVHPVRTCKKQGSSTWWSDWCRNFVHCRLYIK